MFATVLRKPEYRRMDSGYSDHNEKLWRRCKNNGKIESPFPTTL